MIDFKRKLIFIHIPKTAGTSIEVALLDDARLLDHSGPERQRLIRGEYKDNFCGLRHPHASLRQHQQQLGARFAEYKVFTVIRNPWEQTFSRFCYIFQQKKETFFTADNFYKFTLFQNAMNYQSLIGQEGEPHVQYILNYYELQNEANQMLRELRLPEITLPRGNVSRASGMDYRAFYGARARRNVRHYFEYEILRFGWTYESRRPRAVRHEEYLRKRIGWARVSDKCRRLKTRLDIRWSRSVHTARRKAAKFRAIVAVGGSKRDLITATVCTHPPALPGLRYAVESIVGQVDRVCAYLNDIQTVPPWLRHPKIRVVLSSDAAGDLKSNGKHYFSQEIDGYHLIIDDDIVYPPDYARAVVNKIEKYKRKAIVCVHGSVLRQPFDSYYEDRFYFDFRRALREDVRVDVGSNNALAYHTDTVRFSLNDFPSTNMDDLFLSIKAAKMNIPILCIQREDGWLQEPPGLDKRSTIYYNRSKYDAPATALIKENMGLFKSYGLTYAA